MKHHLRGWLAGLGVLPGGQQPPAALRCAARCREGLSLAPDLCLYFTRSLALPRRLRSEL